MKLDEEILAALKELWPVTDLSVMHSALHELLDLMHGPLAAPGAGGVTVDRYNIPAEDGGLLPLRIYRKADSYPAAVLLYVHGATLLDRELDTCDTMCRCYRGAAQCSGLQAGGEGSRGGGRQAASVPYAGRFCCSMYWRTIDRGGPPSLPAK